MAKAKGHHCTALSFEYGQRNRVELDAAKEICRHYNVPHRMIRIDPLTFDRSSLVAPIPMAKNRTVEEIVSSPKAIPNTYVPARNTLFLAYAMGHAEIFDASEIYFGPNRYDIVYPDCSKVYLETFQRLLEVATRHAVCGSPPRLCAPLIDCSKKEIVEIGHRLGAPLHLTLSCYDPQPHRVHCGGCDACVLRRTGFAEAGITDPSQYALHHGVDGGDESIIAGRDYMAVGACSLAGEMGPG
jgi:7-cyano-7-deazaguanine synthase